MLPYSLIAGGRYAIDCAIAQDESNMSARAYRRVALARILAPSPPLVRYHEHPSCRWRCSRVCTSPNVCVALRRPDKPTSCLLSAASAATEKKRQQQRGETARHTSVYVCKTRAASKRIFCINANKTQHARNLHVCCR